jgi:hypothetical protein
MRDGGYRDDNGFSYPEELQMEPDPPRSSFRVWLVAGAIILAVVVGMWAI